MQVHIIGDETIEQNCLKIIDENGEETLSCEKFADLKKENVIKIISRDTLDVSEVTVWSACIRWAKQERQRQGRQVGRFLSVKVVYHSFFSLLFHV